MKRVIIFILFVFTLSILQADYVEKSGDVSGETWGAGTYYVNSDISVSDETILTISAGAVIKFDPGTQLSVYGTLDANGSSPANIVFTTVNDNTFGDIIPGSTGNPQPGDWEGIYLNGTSVNNGIGEFDHCRIRYGGNISGSADANVYFNQSDSGYFDSSICEFSSQDGLKADNCVVEISNSDFESNGGYAAYLTNISIQPYPNNSGSGNTYDAFGINGTVAEDVILSGAVTGFPYVILGRIYVNDECTLTIPENEVLKFTSSGEFFVYGTIAVNGTEINPVVLTSLKDDEYGGDTNGDGDTTSPEPGDWKGIYIHGISENNGIGEFDHCRIRYGGSLSGYPEANIYFYYSDSGYFNNSISEYSGQDGLKTKNCVVDVSGSILGNNIDEGINADDCELQIDGCQFNNNGNYAAYLRDTEFNNNTPFTNNAGSGNSINAFGISGIVSEDMVLSGAVTGFPYVIIDRITVNDECTLTIPENEVLKFTNAGEFLVYGTIAVNGTEANSVVLTSLKDDVYGGDTNGDGDTTSPEPGDWEGICLYGSGDYNGIGEFDNCRIRYGGNSSGYANANVYYNYSDSGFFINSISEFSSQDGLKTSDCVVDVSGSIFDNNNDDGINADDCELQIDGCQFNNNGNYAAYLRDAEFNYSTPITNNAGSGNTINAFGISGTISENFILSETITGFPYVIAERVTVNDECTLTIPENEVLKFTNAGEFLVFGTIAVNGTETNPVVLTSLNDDEYGGDTNGDGDITSPAPGDWEGIWLYGNADYNGIGEFEYCRIRYGGNSGGNADANVEYDNSDPGFFINSISEFSSQDGIKTTNCVVDVTGSSFDNNGDDGIYASGSELQIVDCNFSNNGNYAAYLHQIDLQAYTNNTGSGNTYEAFGINGTVNYDIVLSEAVTGFPYVISGRLTVNDECLLTIPENEVVKFANTGEIYVYGTIDVNGTEINPIVFTSIEDDEYGGDTNGDGSATTPEPGDWGGLFVYGASDNDGIGEFDYCRIRFGGNNSQNADANIYFNQSSPGYFTNSICEYSSQDGLRAGNCAVDISGSSFDNNGDDGINASTCDLQINDCQINNNGNYAVYLYNSDIQAYTNNTGSGNTYDAFSISGTISEDIVLSGELTGFPYVIEGRLTVTDECVLTIPENEVLKFASTGEIYVYGTIDVNGTEINPVVFTSLKDDEFGGDTNNDGNSTMPAPGDWEGIHLQGASDYIGIGEFDHCRIRYGGNISGNADANINFYSSDSGYFSNSYCEYSSQYGVKIYGSSPVFRESVFEENLGYGIYITSNANPDLGTETGEIGINSFINNDGGNYQIYNDGTYDINAYHNIWEFTIADSIDAHIYDDDEDPAKGEVFFEPWFVEDIEITLLSDNPLDFGSLLYGENATMPVVIQNNGTVDLIIMDVLIGETRPEIFEYDYSELPVTLSVGEQDTIYVTFTPDAEGAFEDTLNIINNSFNQPLLQVTLVGAGEFANHAPTIELPDNFTFAEDTPLEINLMDFVNDIDGDDLVITITGNEFIEADIAAMMVTFTADVNWNGSEILTFTVDDQQGRLTVSDDVEVIVTPVNDAPTIELPESFTFEEGGSVVIDFTPYISDIDGDSLLITRSGGFHITVGIDEYMVTLSNPNNWNGTENVTFTVDDQQVRLIASDIVAVIITPVNDPPVISLPPSFSFPENDSLIVNFAPYLFDVDGDELTIASAGNQNVFVEINDHLVTFSAAANWNGSEVITFTVDDQQGRLTASDDVEIIVTSVNDAPTIELPDSFTIEEDGIVEIDFSEYVDDANGDEVVITCDNTENITVEISGLLVTLGASENWNGSEMLTFTVDDQQVRLTDSDNVEIIVTSVNDAPTIELPESFTFEEDGFWEVDFSEYVDDVDIVNIADLELSVENNVNVIVTITGLMVNLEAVENWNGSETLSFIVDDQQGRSTASDDVEIIVTSVNDAPAIISYIPADLDIFVTIASSVTTANVAFELTVEDVDDAVLTYNWYIDDDLESSSAVNTFDHDFASGSYTVTGEVSDSEYTDSVTWNLTVYSAAGDLEDSEITVDDISIDLGDSGNVTVSTSPLVLAWNVTSYNFTMSFDNTVADYDGYSVAGTLSENTIVSVTDNGDNIVVEGSSTEALEGGGALIIFNFASIAAGVSNLDITDFNYNDTAITTITNGSVTVVNYPPELILPIFDYNREEDFADFQIDLSDHFADLNDDVLYYSAEYITSELDISINGEILTISSVLNWFGAAEFTVTASDGHGELVSDTAVINISPVNDAPTIILPDSFTFVENGSLEVDFAPYVDDVDGDELIAVNEITDNITVEINDLLVTLGATEDWDGIEMVTFMVYDTVTRMMASDSVNVIVTPVDFYADFEADNTEVGIGQDVQFTDLSSETAVSWEWDFENDGTIDSYEQNPIWEYLDVGIYSVSLTITDEVGRITANELKEDYINVIDLENFPRPWEVVDYSNSTVAYCEVRIDGEPASEGDEVGTFVDYECRGVGSVINSGDIAISVINVQGEEVETLEFAVWDASHDLVCSVSFTTQSNPGGEIGSVPNFLPIYAVTSQYEPLVADFEANYTEVESGQQIQFTDLSTSNATTWEWDFENDGEIDSSEQNPVWTYQEAGLYSVSLNVTDEISRESSTEVKTDYITVIDPPLYFYLPGDISFNEDESTSLNLETYTNGDPQELSVSWSGNTEINITNTGLTLVFTPSVNWFGSEFINIEITDGIQTASDEIQVTVEPVNDAPVIVLPVSFEFMEDGELQVDFSGYVSDVDSDNLMLSAEGSEYITVEISQLWVTFSTEETWNGSEMITFTIDDGQGRLTASDEVEVIVIADPPTADFIADIISGDAPLTVNFTDLSSNDVISWEWDFDNDETIDSYLQNPEWIYQEAGTYTISLTVSDGINSDNITKIDYIEATPPAILNPPQNPAVEILNDTEAIFTWQQPEIPDPGQWLHYDNGINYTGIGLGYGGSFKVAIRWDAGDLIPYDGEELSRISFFPNSNTSTFILKIWTGSNASNQVYSQMVIPEEGSWNDVLLNTPYTINGSEELWIGYEITDQPPETYPAGLDDSASVTGYGNKISTNGETWNNLSELGLGGNWNLQAFVADAARPLNITRAPSKTQLSAIQRESILSVQRNTEPVRLTRDFLGYDVFLNGVLQNQTAITDTQFTFTNLTPGEEYTAGVAALYDEGSSDMVTSIFTMPISFIADFIADTTYTAAGTEIQFNDLSTGNPVTWAWDFQNDSVIDSNEQNPTWAYEEPGVYDVVLTITNNQTNTDYEIKEAYITVHPDWYINPPDYEYSGSMWGVVYHEDVIVDHTEGILGCFVGEECRGIASFEDGSVLDYTDIPEFNHIAFIPMIYSNVTSGETVTFKYWDPYIEDVYDVSQTVDFIANMVIGNGFDPFQWHTTTAITITNSIISGWNWFSLNVAAEDMSINSVLASIGNQGTSIKNQTQSALYYDGMGWFGSLLTMDNLTFYKLQANAPAELEFTGVPVNVSETQYDMIAGWNWISYAPQQPEDINYALGSLQNGLNIKNQTQSAIYYDGMGWFGSLLQMQPLAGYMIKLSAAEELIYPEPQANVREILPEPDFSCKELNWSLDPHAWEFNGIIIARIESDQAFNIDDYILGVFCGDELRGISSSGSGSVLDYTEPLGSIYHTLMVYSNEAEGDQLSFVLYDRNAKELYDLDLTMPFSADMVIGNWQQPLSISAPDTDDIGIIPAECSLTCYPNPFNPQTTLSYALNQTGNVQIEVYNVKGQKIETILNTEKEAGSYSLTWQADNLASGIYLIKFAAPHYNKVQRVMLLK